MTIFDAPGRKTGQKIRREEEVHWRLGAKQELMFTSPNR